MNDIKYLQDSFELEWGKISKEKVLRKMYKNKATDKMTDKEINKMLEDLI